MHKATRDPLDVGDAARAVLLVAITLLSCLPLLLKYPAPGGDEPGFVDVAYSFARHGTLSTESHLGLLPGAERHIYWQPPAYFLALGTWFRVFGVTLAAARTFSLVWALVTVVLVYLIARNEVPRGPATVASGLFAISFWLTNRASVARMDMMCIALTIGAILAYQFAINRGSRLLYGVAGFLAALAFLTHPLGLVAVVTLCIHGALTRDAQRRTTHHYWFLGLFAIPIVLWLLYIAEDPSVFVAQMRAQLERKKALGSYWYQFWMAKTHIATLVIACSASVWLVARSWRNREHLLVATAFVTSFIAATFGRETGYFSYFYPFACLAIAIVLSEKRKSSWLLTPLVALAFLNETAILTNDVRRYRHRDYDELTRTVRTAIPPGTTVFLAYPDVSPYFALVGRNRMRIAVPTPTSPHAHRDAAVESDYIVASTPVTYLPEVNGLLSELTPTAVIDQGPGFRLEVYRSPGPAER